MNIILGDENLPDISAKATTLELDSFRINNDPTVVRAWCVLEDINIQELSQLDNLTSLHSNLIKNYRLRNWNYCEQALDHLKGKWNGQLDSFYENLAARVKDLKNQDLSSNWDGVIQKNTG